MHIPVSSSFTWTGWPHWDGAPSRRGRVISQYACNTQMCWCCTQVTPGVPERRTGASCHGINGIDQAWYQLVGLMDVSRSSGDIYRCWILQKTTDGWTSTSWWNWMSLDSIVAQHAEPYYTILPKTDLHGFFTSWFVDARGADSSPGADDATHPDGRQSPGQGRGLVYLGAWGTAKNGGFPYGLPYGLPDSQLTSSFRITKLFGRSSGRLRVAGKVTWFTQCQLRQGLPRHKKARDGCQGIHHREASPLIILIYDLGRLVLEST